jgi:antitoxin component YwqK of YwqJK toxin-antitoxin module
MNIDGMKNGDFKTYHSNGELIEQSIWMNGEKFENLSI